MRHPIVHHLKATLASVLLLAVAGLVLGACGDSNGSSSSSSTAASTPTASTTATTPAPSSPATAKPAEEANVTVKRAAFNRALIKFASCLRKRGIPIPPPDTSGKGPLFNTKGLDTNSAKFKAARDKCIGVLSKAAKAPTSSGAGSG